MTFKESVLNSYKLSSSNRNLNDHQKAELLFNIVLKLIIKNKWIYLPEGNNYSVELLLDSNSSESLQVNCFELSNMLITLFDLIRLRDAKTFLYQHKPTSKIGQQISEGNSESQYTFRCFDDQFDCIDNQVCFDQHCVVTVNGRFYDLVFSCSYDNAEEPYDNNSFAKVFSFLDSNNEVEALRALQNSNDIDLEQTFGGDTLLHIAARNNFLTIVSFLLDKGVDANKLSNLNPPEVALANVTDNDSELFKLLSEKTNPLIVNEIKKNNDMRRFNEAFGIIASGSVEEFSNALKGLDINFKDDIGWTLFHYAASLNNFSITEFLINKCADANIRNGENYVPLQYANDPKLFSLLSKNTNPLIVSEIKKNNDMRRFNEAYGIIESGSVEEFSNALKGLDINFKDDIGWTLLHYAASLNNFPITEFLINKCADTNIRNGENYVPLHYANDPKLFSLLSKNTNSLIVNEIKKINDMRRFNEAVEIINTGGSVDAFSKTLQGLDLNFKGDYGWTLLHFAASKNHLLIAEYLLEKGADANIKEETGLVALQYVAEDDLAMYQFLDSKTKKLTSERSIDEVEPSLHTFAESQFIPPKTSIDNETIESNFSKPVEIATSGLMNISMQILGGFMAVVGCAAVAAAFVLLNVSTLGVAGLLVAGLGVVSIIVDVGFFATGTFKDKQLTIDESFRNRPSAPELAL